VAIQTSFAWPRWIAALSLAMTEDPMFIDDDLPKHKLPEPFPRKLVGKSVEEMREYRADLLEEIAKIDAEIASRGGVRAQAENLFK
jgi:uncharacterized small protein (DUF1192 family)